MEDAEGDVGGFLADGYSMNNAVVMQSTDVPRVPAPTIDARLRPFAPAGGEAESEWTALVELSVATRDPHYGEEGYRSFARQRVASWRALARAGRGNWFGAFIDQAGSAPRLVAALGVYAEAEREDGQRLARYQSVMTDGAYRRRGLCRALIAMAARHAREMLQRGSADHRRRRR